MANMKLRGVRAPHRKNTSQCQPVPIPVPAVVTIPMSMHIGAPAVPVVKAGDEVKVGQRIADPGGFVSSPVYASVSGKVKKLDQILVANGSYVNAVVIESDGLQTPFEELRPHPAADRKEFIDAVRDSGVVGLGGAGFPTAVKLNVEPERVEAIIINGAECEPYITSDTRTMLDESHYLWEGVLLLKKFYEPARLIIATEQNKPECVKVYRELAAGADGVEVAALPSIYPQGGEKVLIYNTTGRIVQEGKLPIDAGVVVINCTTLAAIMKYIETGMPLVSKVVTVDGSAVKEPKNVIVPIGTAMRDVFDFCGGFKSEPRKVLYGGPMMGIAVPSTEVPILKNTNAILAFDARDAAVPRETPCIKCGRCIANCPMNLMPAEMDLAFRTKNPKRLETLKVNLCIECGSCTYNCPAKRLLVQSNKLAKAMLRDYQQAQKAKEAAAVK